MELTGRPIGTIIRGKTAILENTLAEQAYDVPLLFEETLRS
jgi:hypothetical protein